MSGEKKQIRMYNLSKDASDSRDFVMYSKNTYSLSNRNKDVQTICQSEQIIVCAPNNFAYVSVVAIS